MQAAAPWSKGLPGLWSHLCAAASFHSTPASPAKWKGKFDSKHEHGERKLSKPSLISDDADVVALVGTSKDLAKQINQKEVHWGLLEDSVEERMEKALSDSDRAEAESKDADAEDNNKKKSSKGGNQGGSLNKRLKKDKLVGPTGKNTKSETSMVSAAPRVKPELTLPATLVGRFLNMAHNDEVGGSGKAFWELSQEMEEEPHRYEDAAEDTDPDYTTPSDVGDATTDGGAEDATTDDGSAHTDGSDARSSLLCDGSLDDRYRLVM